MKPYEKFYINIQKYEEVSESMKSNAKVFKCMQTLCKSTGSNPPNDRQIKKKIISKFKNSIINILFLFLYLKTNF